MQTGGVIIREVLKKALSKIQKTKNQETRLVRRTTHERMESCWR